jgi:glucosamine-6-phosphate deaminase
VKTAVFRTFEKDMAMKIVKSATKKELGQKAAAHAAELIRRAINKTGRANVIVATGASQFEMLENLVKEPDIAWHSVVCFHLDEYVGMPITHKASFRKYLWERFVSRLTLPLGAFHYVNGEGDPESECERLGRVIKDHPIDVALVGIGENAHLAFNDPPADFKTERAYVVVSLDEACRKQQLGEGWFASLGEVPRQAISMSCRQIMKSRAIIASVPDARKANAVKASVHGPIQPEVPSSILQGHEDCTIYVDQQSGALV